GERAIPDGGKRRGSNLTGLGRRRLDHLAGTVEDEAVLEWAAQGPQRADHALAIFPYDAWLAALDALPFCPIEGDAIRPPLLHALAELDGDPRYYFKAAAVLRR